MNQTKPAPLGRGLSALFGDADTSYQTKSAVFAPPPEKRGVMHVSIGQVMPGPFQPRRLFDDASLKELAESVASRGILQPLIVRPGKGPGARYEIIAGERRWRAAQLANLHEVPVVIRDIADSEALEYGLIENVQRQDLSPLEEAEGYRRLMDDFQHTQEGLSKIVGKSRSHVANALRLISLPADVKQLIDEGKISAGHARALINARNPRELAMRIIREGLTVREAEALAKGEKLKGDAAPGVAKAANRKDADTLMIEKQLGLALGLKVSIDVRGKSGTLTLHYKDFDQLDVVLKKLGS